MAERLAWGVSGGYAVGMLAEYSLEKVPFEYVLFLVGIGLLIWAVGRVRRKKVMPPTATVEMSGMKPTDIRAMTDELRGVFAELQETARRITAQIDNRVTKLDLLIQEADEKIKQMEALKQQSLAATNTPTRTEKPADSIDPRNRRIYELADQGHSPREIAQQVGGQAGEIELILNLREGGREETRS